CTEDIFGDIWTAYYITHWMSGAGNSLDVW
nr:immunoglobulin heavy chain junction region [Macaca mulatta]